MTPSLAHKPFIVPVFIPHAGCPHRCIFCDQTRTTSQAERVPTADELDETIRRFLSYRNDPGRYTEISYYGGNFLGLTEDRIMALLAHAAQYVARGEVNGIRFSTRPDTIDQRRLHLLERFPVTTVELGVQSMNNKVLATVLRGHTAQDARHAAALLKKTPYRLGAQMMLGLPGDSVQSALATGAAIRGLAPDFVRIYPTLVLKGSVLARWHGQDRYTPLRLEEAVDLAKTLYALFMRSDIRVVRMGLQATDGLDLGEDLVDGPYHPAFGELVHSAQWLSALRKGIDALHFRGSELEIRLNPRLVSRVKGQRNKNMQTLTREYTLSKIHLITDQDLSMDQILLNGQPCPFL
ncbi:MAG: radical SAM protein [Desulfobacteraceae bacterium]